MPKRSPSLRKLLLIGAVVAAGFVGWRREAAAPAAPAPDVAHPAVARPALAGKPGEDVLPATPAARALFRFIQPADAAALTFALPAPSQEVRYVHVAADLVRGKQSPFWQAPGVGRVDLPLPEGGAVTVAIEGSEMLGPDRFTSSGRIEGRPASRVLFAWNGGFLHASIEDPVLGNFALRVATAEVSQFYRVDPALVPPCGGERRPRMEGAAQASSATTVAPAAAAPPLAAAQNPQRPEVHVMMLYTQSVLPTLSGAERVAALQSAFDLAIAKVNSTFEASLITARVKLVRIAETAYDENASTSAKVQDDALTALYQENDGRMDEIHALRNQCGADIVCLALERRDSASSGLSFLLDSSNELTNPNFAFSVVQYSFVAGSNVVPHELGHVFGCAHDRQNALSGPGAFSFSYGYRFLGADGRQYHDIMSYPPGTELGYFSNPDVLLPDPVGVLAGIAEGRPGESNTALTIERTAFATAAYRLQTQAAPNPGTLINIATRAFIGRGNDVLIGGFVVQGQQPKRLLVRAVGPALQGFGVTNALPDPVLRVYANGAVVAENDNWSVPVGGSAASAVEIALATAQVHAFALPGGSADSALMVTLPPGAYSAVVEGAHDSTGAGMVEVYQMEPTTARIVNLAARGYAGREGQEMVAGFVVEGAAGTTKRILIRVLGPTLGRAPFNLTGVLDDPEMELRNAAGQLLLRSDDWSTAAEGGASTDNDFHPVIDLYGEKQIFATGLAPTNRREPCVLADLPPGNFTVIVRPYESQGSGTTRDQAAVPGVGVVEVYEISP